VLRIVRATVALRRVAVTPETLRNNLNPVFTTPILVDYFFEEVQYLKFEVRAVECVAPTHAFAHDLNNC
jgi:hypothetical protein